MGKTYGFFERLFARLKLHKKTGNGISINLSVSSLGKRIDIAQEVLDAQVWSDLKEYMPEDTGTLISDTAALNSTTWGEVYCYPPGSDYGHYQYEGIMYADPDYGIGAFYNPDYGYWSRPGIEKIATDRKLEYGKESAEPHWDEAAYRDHKRDWIKVAKNAMKG